MGLSTQVPGRYVYLSDGPPRSYTIEKVELEFKNTALKETAFKLSESGLIVQALKSLGAERITCEVISRIRGWLNPGMREQVLKDTKIVTGWVYDAIKKICREGS